MRKFIKWTAIVLGVLLIAGLAIGYTPDTDAAAMRAKYGAPPSQFVDLGGGLTVHLRDTGPRDAPVLMLVHGSNSDLHVWDGWADRLDERYRVIRFDLPGHGLTGADPARSYSGSAYADVVERVRARLGIDRIGLAGNSMGGAVSWHYALKHPKHLAGLILVDAAGQPDPGERSPALGFRIAQTPLLNRILLVVTPRSLIAQTAGTAYANPAAATDARIDRIWELLRYPGNRQATVDRFALPRDEADPAQLRTLSTPTLILWGAQDQLIPLASARWFAANIPGSKLIVYPATGHLPMEEAPDASAKDAAAFMDGLK